jgi:predicted CoA-substrate-specific enzyme activase
MYFAGIDIGSTMTKVVVLDEGNAVLAQIIGPTGAEHRRLANKVMEEALLQAGLSFEQMTVIIATGYGRFNVPFADRQVSELSCHARGVSMLFPNSRTIIDIGGQDAKGIKVKNGKLLEFVMNDKCAAGTGRFLEVTAKTLGLRMEEFGEISLKSTRKVAISNICTVFAQNEIIDHLSKGIALEDILAGLHSAIAGRVISMVKKLNIEPDVVLTGGVAKNAGVVKAFEEKLGFCVFVPEEPLITGALGAAILGKESAHEYLLEVKPISSKERILKEVAFYG